MHDRRAFSLAGRGPGTRCAPRMENRSGLVADSRCRRLRGGRPGFGYLAGSLGRDAGERPRGDAGSDDRPLAVRICLFRVKEKEEGPFGPPRAGTRRPSALDVPRLVRCSSDIDIRMWRDGESLQVRSSTSSSTFAASAPWPSRGRLLASKRRRPVEEKRVKREVDN